MTMPASASTSSEAKKPSFPFDWDDIATKLDLPSLKEVPKLILSPPFLNQWVFFRDHLPLTPGTPLCIAVNDKAAMTEFVTIIYTMMDSMAASPYDRPTDDERKDWGPVQYTRCLIYRSARDLAVEKQPFYEAFLRKNQKNESGRNRALLRLRGLVMLAANLAVNYTGMAPSNVIRRIEAMQPAKKPDLSPIPEVRKKWKLDNMGVDELRKKVLGSERHGDREKEWLIKILMGKEGSGEGEKPFKIKVESEGIIRAREGDGEEARKRARME